MLYEDITQNEKNAHIPRDLQWPHQGAKHSTRISFSSLTLSEKFFVVRSRTSDSALTPASMEVAARPTRATAADRRMMGDYEEMWGEMRRSGMRMRRRDDE